MVDDAILNRPVRNGSLTVHHPRLDPLVLDPALVLHATKVLDAPQMLRPAKMLASHVLGTPKMLGATPKMLNSTTPKVLSPPHVPAAEPTDMPAAEVAAAAHVSTAAHMAATARMAATTSAMAMTGVKQWCCRKCNSEESDNSNAKRSDHGQNSW